MAIKGNLREASLPDVLQLLALGQKTGCLSVTDRTNFGHIFFDRGDISYASIVNRRDRLGDLLVKNGLIAPEVLAGAIEAQDARSGKRLGEILIDRGAITREQLERYIRVQIEEAVYFLFTWTQGTFSFIADERPDEGAMVVAIHPESLLLEGARRVDEWSLIEKKIPSFDLVFGVTPSISEVEEGELTPEQRQIIPILDGKRSVREVIEEAGIVEFDVGKALFGLIQAGLVHQLGRKSTPKPSDATPGRVEERRNLAIAFYRTGMLQEAAQEFRRVLELSPDDLSARFYLGLVDLRSGRARPALRRFQELIERGAGWGSAFHSVALALEQLGFMDDALLALDQARSVLGDYPPLLLSNAILLCKAGRVREASEAFESYRSRVGEGDRAPASYFAFAMIAEAACGRLPEAQSIAEEGVRHYPHVSPVLLHAGAIRERMGAWEEAEMLYRRAVEEDPTLVTARKALADALYRRTAYADAAEQYDRVVASPNGNGDDALFKLGNIRYKQGDRLEAVRLWRRALELNPDNGIARTNLELVEKTLDGGQG